MQNERRGSLISVYTVCPDMSVRTLKIIMVIKYEPPHDKTNKMACVCPAKTQISLGICPVWSIFAVCMKKAWVLSYPLSAQRSLWSGRMPRLIWVFAARSHFVGFVMLQLICQRKLLFSRCFAPLSTIFQSYRDDIWMRQWAKYLLYIVPKSETEGFDSWLTSHWVIIRT